MSKVVLTDVVVDSVDLSDHVSSVGIPLNADEVETTAFQGSGWRTFLAGLKDGNFELNFHQDFDASKVDATLWPHYNAGTTFTVTLIPTSGSVSSTNPSWSGTFLLLNYSPLAGSVGALSETSVTMRLTGALTRATS